MNAITYNEAIEYSDNTSTLDLISIQGQIDSFRVGFRDQIASVTLETGSERYLPETITHVNSGAGIVPISALAEEIVLNFSPSMPIENNFIVDSWKLSDTNPAPPSIVASVPSSYQPSLLEWAGYIRNKLPRLKDCQVIAQRLEHLIDELSTDDEEPQINIDSLSTFAMFLASNDIEKRPTIGVDSQGCIDALWRTSDEMLIEILFRPGHESILITFAPDIANPTQIHKRVATLPIVSIVGILEHRNLLPLLYH